MPIFVSYFLKESFKILTCIVIIKKGDNVSFLCFDDNNCKGNGLNDSSHLSACLMFNGT